jgi:hypothetical protein
MWVERGLQPASTPANWQAIAKHKLKRRERRAPFKTKNKTD